jgi:hypothetical protein
VIVDNWTSPRCKPFKFAFGERILHDEFV